MVGEPSRRRRDLNYFLMLNDTVLRPGKYVVYDKHGRRFTTANDEGYATRLAQRLGGTMNVDSSAEEST